MLISSRKDSIQATKSSASITFPTPCTYLIHPVVVSKIDSPLSSSLIRMNKKAPYHSYIPSLQVVRDDEVPLLDTISSKPSTVSHFVFRVAPCLNVLGLSIISFESPELYFHLVTYSCRQCKNTSKVVSISYNMGVFS